ncbi:MAG: S41 family peptidase [Candidatus Nomurabacteria bacterium]|jgi:carboxyl-terminal processing protease|nr:S41 family peptidase [Candidatus Nomurabacteria bacterium]
MIERKGVSVGALIAAVAITLVFGFVAGTRKDEIFEAVGPMLGQKVAIAPNWSELNEVYKALKNHYDGSVSDSQIIEGAKKGLVAAAGDDYTIYMDRVEAEEFSKSLSGDVGAGIGVEIGQRNGVPTILRVLKDNPAKAAGVLAGDIVVMVNDEDMSGKTTDEVASRIRGEDGTSVKVKFYRSGEELELNIVRAKINNPSVELSYKNNVAIITISRFDQETGSLVKNAAKEINDKGIDKIILDLRGNGGGYVSAAQDVLSLWLQDKLLLTEKANGRVIDTIRSGGNAPLAGKKTIVLADGSSASASEIVVGALKDYKAATFVGEKTFGKGSVQDQISLSGGGLLKVTIGRWYTPNDTNINKSGIKPDIEVKMTADDINGNNDTQLKRALEILK